MKKFLKKISVWKIKKGYMGIAKNEIPHLVLDGYHKKLNFKKSKVIDLECYSFKNNGKLFKCLVFNNFNYYIVDLNLQFAEKSNKNYRLVSMTVTDYLENQRQWKVKKELKEFEVC